MPIERITADDLRDMEHQEGLVLQGCGGEAQEWLDGINDLLTQDGILQNGSRFETVKVFQHDGLNNLLFPFENIQVDMGKLAMWRLQTHGAFGGTWLSDYVPNRLGGFRSARQENPRPLCPLLGQDGNIFHLMGIAARVLRQNGMAAEAKEMIGGVTIRQRPPQELHDLYVEINRIGNNINQIARKANAGFATKEDVRELKFLMRTIEAKMTELVKQ